MSNIGEAQIKKRYSCKGVKEQSIDFCCRIKWFWWKNQAHVIIIDDVFTMIQVVCHTLIIKLRISVASIMIECYFDV